MSTAKRLRTRKCFGFTLFFANAIDELTDEFLNAIYESGCDDATISMREGVLRIGFDREAPNLEIALVSAIAEVQRSGLQLELSGIEMDS